jgi:hypothetical protein
MAHLGRWRFYKGGRSGSFDCTLAQMFTILRGLFAYNPGPYYQSQVHIERSKFVNLVIILLMDCNTNDNYHDYKCDKVNICKVKNTRNDKISRYFSDIAQSISPICISIMSYMHIQNVHFSVILL